MIKQKLKPSTNNNIKNIESLDFMFKKGFINHNQLKAGIYYRVLYSNFIGNKRIKAYDIARTSGKDIDHKDPEERIMLANKYKEICDSLNKYHLTPLIINLCIFNILPKQYQIKDVVDGLELIVEYFTKNGGIRKIAL